MVPCSYEMLYRGPLVTEWSTCVRRAACGVRRGAWRVGRGAWCMSSICTDLDVSEPVGLLRVELRRPVVGEPGKETGERARVNVWVRVRVRVRIGFGIK